MSPIAGLTDRNKTFMCLAKIKKGAEITEDAQGKKSAPRDLDHFRVVFKEGKDKEKLEAAFLRLYGPKPISIDMRLPFKTVQENWDAFFTVYKTGGLYATAGSFIDSNDVEHLYWERYRDPATSEVWIRNRRAVCPAGEEFINQPIDISKPIYFNAKNEPVLLKPEGRLSLVVPGLAKIDGEPKVGYFDFTPTSARDIGTISAELAGIAYMAESVGKDITGIPMKLIRRKEEVTVRIKDKLSRKFSWVVHIEVGGEWGGKALEVMEMLALPDPNAQVYDNDDDVFDGEAEDVTEETKVSVPTAPAVRPTAPRAPAAPQTAQTPAPAVPGRGAAVAIQTNVTDDDGWQPPDFDNPPPSGPATAKPAETPQLQPGEMPISRPWSPLMFQSKLAEAVGILNEGARKRNVALTVGKDDYKILSNVIDKIFGGDKGVSRHIVCAWLVGTGSTKEMSPAVIKALFHVMGIKGVPQYESEASAESVTEFQSALAAAQSELQTKGA